MYSFRNISAIERGRPQSAHRGSTFVSVPIIVVSNKADIARAEEGLVMSTATGVGVDEVLEALMEHYRPPTPAEEPGELSADEAGQA